MKEGNIRKKVLLFMWLYSLIRVIKTFLFEEIAIVRDKSSIFAFDKTQLPFYLPLCGVDIACHSMVCPVNYRKRSLTY